MGKVKAGLIRRSVDSKGRVVLPMKGLDEVYMAVVGEVILVSPNPNAIRELCESLNEISSVRKKRAISEWFGLVKKAGLDKLPPKLIDKLVSRSIVRELE